MLGNHLTTHRCRWYASTRFAAVFRTTGSRLKREGRSEAIPESGRADETAWVVAVGGVPQARGPWSRPQLGMRGLPQAARASINAAARRDAGGDERLQAPPV